MSSRVLHIMQCVGGGAPVQLMHHVRVTPQFQHIVVWPEENHEIAKGQLLTLIPMPEGRLAQMRHTRRMIRETEPDVVVAHSSWAGMYARALPYRVPIIYEPHGWVFTYPSWKPMERRLFRQVEKALVNRTYGVVTHSDAEADVARQLGHRRVMVLPSTSRADSAADRSTGQVVMMAGRVTSVKDPVFYASVARLVRASRPDVRFRWVGGGDQDLTAVLKGAHVEVTGWVDEQVVWDEMASASLYVHTSASEAFGLTVLDAAHLGTPMVLRDIPAFAGLPGVRPATPDAMAKAVLAFLDGSDTSPRDVQEAVAARIDSDAAAVALSRVFSVGRSG